MSETTHILSRSLPTSFRRLIVLGLLVIACLVVNSVGMARADGDPASDVLVAQSMFVPSDASVTAGDQARLAAVLAAANRAAYPIRVALVASSWDLGAITSLWHQPQNYAHFLWQELSLAVHGPVLVVMPGGFGFYAGGWGPSAAQRAAIQRITPPGARNGLASAAVRAVEKLAAVAGHPLPAAINVPKASHAAPTGGADVMAWVVFGLGAVLIAAAWGVSLRVRKLHRGASRE